MPISWKLIFIIQRFLWLSFLQQLLYVCWKTTWQMISNCLGHLLVMANLCIQFDVCYLKYYQNVDRRALNLQTDRPTWKSTGVLRNTPFQWSENKVPKDMRGSQLFLQAYKSLLLLVKANKVGILIIIHFNQMNLIFNTSMIIF